MTAEQFNQHGWKATDKVVFEGQVYEIRSPDFEIMQLSIYEKGTRYAKWVPFQEIELYQPIHEAHAHLLTNPD